MHAIFFVNLNFLQKIEAPYSKLRGMRSLLQFKEIPVNGAKYSV
jgi:hypothetical protein